MSTRTTKRKSKNILTGPLSIETYDSTVDDRISYLESLARRYEHRQALDEAYQEGIKKGKNLSFWPTFVFGVVYGMVVYYSLFTKKGTTPGNTIGFKPA